MIARVMSGAPEEGFTHLAVDTSTLVNAGWPHPAVDLNNVVVGCNTLGIPVLLPRLVLDEAAFVWSLKTAEMIKSAKLAIQRADGRLRLAQESIDGRWPTKEQYEATYQSAVEATLARWKCQILPLPPVSLEDVIGRAVRHDPPFAAKDVGFRDSLIVLTLLNHVERGGVLAIVAADNGFADSRIARAATDRGVTVRIFKTPEEAWSATEGLIETSESAADFARWDAKNERLVSALESDMPALSTFIRDNIEIPYTPWFGRLQSIEEVRVVQVLGIEAAHVGFGVEDKNTKGGARLGDENASDAHALTDETAGWASVTLNVEAIVNDLIPQTPAPTVRVGPRKRSWMPSFPLAESFGNASIKTFGAYADVELTVLNLETSPVIKYRSVTFATEEDRRRAEAELNDD